MESLHQLFGIGLEPKDLGILQVCSRGVTLFFYCIFLVRIADKRFLSTKSALDAVLGFMFASMMARAINGSAPFVPTLVVGLLMVLLHRGLAHLAMRWHHLGALLKGSADLLIDDGKPVMENLRKHSVTEADLIEDLRLKGVASPQDVRCAYIERNGRTSVIKQSK